MGRLGISELNNPIMKLLFSILALTDVTSAGKCDYFYEPQSCEDCKYQRGCLGKMGYKEICADDFGFTGKCPKPSKPDYCPDYVDHCYTCEQFTFKELKKCGISDTCRNTFNWHPKKKDAHSIVMKAIQVLVICASRM